MIPQHDRYYFNAHPKQRERVRRLMYQRSGGKCAICGEPLAFEGMHLDHIIPLARGGEDAEDNLQATHPRCNRSKSDKGDAPYLYPPSPITRDGRMMIGLLAERVGLSPSTLRLHIKRGDLMAAKIGRDWFVSPNEAKRYEDEHAGKRGTSSPRHPGTGGRPPKERTDA